MYLSRIRLNTRRRSTQLALSSPGRIHGAVESCFSEKEERKLWRIDRLGGEYYLLIVSRSRPDLAHLREQFGFPGEADEIRSYDAFLQSIEEGTVWQFRLAANPVHSVKKEGQTRGRVTAHVSEKYQMEYLHQKAARNGFTVLTEGSCVVSSGWKIFTKNGKGARVRLKEAVYQGLLRVDDADLFRKALTDGIGRGKAYGMGLLTIMRMQGTENGE